MRNREQLSKGEQQYLSNKLTGWKIVSFFLPGLGQIWSRRRGLWWGGLCIALCLSFLGYITGDSQTMEGAGCISWLINVILTLVKFTEKAYRHDMPYFQKYLNEYGKLNSGNESNGNNNYEGSSLSNMNKKSEEDNKKIQNHNTINKKNWFIVIFIIFALVLLLGIGFFISTKYVSKEFIYQETKECNNMINPIDYLEDCEATTRWQELTKGCTKYTFKEVFYSPKWNECIISYKKEFRSTFYIKGTVSNNIDEYTIDEDKHSCKIYKDGEMIKNINLLNNENCSDKTEKIWLDEINKLKRWY